MPYPVHLIWDVAQHNCGTNIGAVEDALAADTIVLICWMTVDSLNWQRVWSRTVADQATFVVHARLRTAGRVKSALTSPMTWVDGDPLEGVLHETLAWKQSVRGVTYLSIVTPDRVSRKATNSAVGSIDTVELNAEMEEHFVVIGTDMSNLADWAEGLADILYRTDHHAVVDLGELVGKTLRVRINEDRQLDLALVLVEVGSLLRFCDSILVC